MKKKKKSRTTSKFSLFGGIKFLTEQEKEEQRELEVIRDDGDLDFEEQMAKAAKNVNAEGNVDLPSYLTNTNAL